MSINKSDREKANKTLESWGYKQSSANENKYLNGNKTANWSSSGGSVNLIGTKYTDLSSFNKTTKK